MKNWGQRQKWGTHLIVLHTFHQLTVLSANKEETGKRFVCDSTSYYLKHPVRAITAFLCNLARISAFGNADREPSLLSAARSFIHSFRHLLLPVGRHEGASVSQGNPGESSNFSLQGVYNLVEKIRHAVKAVNREEHFECCNVGRGQVLCECARRKNLALDGKGRRLKK